MPSRWTRKPPRSPAVPCFLALLALVVVVPLIYGGPSCGHDFGFHMQSWMDASAQLRHGTLLPRWAFSPAFNAGEPRFIFYPPLSWLAGSALLLLLPASAVAAAPAVYTWLALTGAAFAMYALARRFSTRNGAFLATAVYLANPYLLFTAFERTAYAELLAAAWMPLLFRAALAGQISAPALALPLGLLWLTNAPAAVMGTYALAVLVLCRALFTWGRIRRGQADPQDQPLLSLLGQAMGGLVLGLALAGFYLLPAAYERRYVQIAMAIIPNMRVEDNFLFGHTGYGPHDQVLHTASVVAIELVVLTTIALACAFFGKPRMPKTKGTAVPDATAVPRRTVLPPLLVLAALVTTMLWHPTLPLWHILPELVFLQFPWRLLALLGCVLGLTVALALGRMRLSTLPALSIAVAVVAIATALAIVPLREGCEAQELLPARMALFGAHHGVGPTDEYTPTDADNDQLRWDDPDHWLTKDPNAPGPGTVPNPASTIVDYDQPPPLDQTVSGRSPMHLQLHLSQPRILVLNLRAYPTWQATVNGNAHPTHLQRDDGLLALAMPAGDDTIDIRWRTLPDMWAGDTLSAAALLATLGLGLRSRNPSRRIEN